MPAGYTCGRAARTEILCLQIATLRTAFTLNFGLKRLFLSDTDLSSEGAICLAEFLPEAKSLIHLDLTENYEIDIAGVMALAVSLRMNTSLRCLDLNVPVSVYTVWWSGKLIV